MCNSGPFSMIRKNLNLRTFFNCENWMGDKNLLFLCLVIANYGDSRTYAPAFPPVENYTLCWIIDILTDFLLRG